MAANKTTQNTTVIPSDWNNEDYNFWYFCAPKSMGWTGIILGMFTELERGRNYDEKTGSIIDVQKIGQEIRGTLCMSDCNDFIATLERIALALENPDGPTISIKDLIGYIIAADLPFGVDDLLEYLQILDILTGIIPDWEISIPLQDIPSMLSQLRFRNSTLNYAQDIALSQRGINIATGGVPIQPIYENLEDMFNASHTAASVGVTAGLRWFYEVVSGDDITLWGDFLTVVTGLIMGNLLSATYGVEQAIEDLELSIADPNMLTALSTISDAIQASDETTLKELSNAIESDGNIAIVQKLADLVTAVDLIECSHTINCSCGCGGQIGIVSEPTPIDDPADGCVPDNFEGVEQYQEHSDSFVSFAIDNIAQILCNFGLMADIGTYFVNEQLQNAVYNQNDLFQRVSDMSVTLASNLWWGNVPIGNRNDLVAAMADYVNDYVNDYVSKVPEFDEPFDLQNRWFYGFTFACQILQRERKTIIETLEPPATSTGWKEFIDNTLHSAIDMAIGEGALFEDVAKAKSMADFLVSTAHGLLGVVDSEGVRDYPTTYSTQTIDCQCAGSVINDSEYNFASGISSGGGNFSGDPLGNPVDENFLMDFTRVGGGSFPCMTIGRRFFNDPIFVIDGQDPITVTHTDDSTTVFSDFSDIQVTNVKRIQIYHNQYDSWDVFSYE